MEKAKPFLRWAGGKRWLARSLAPLLRARLQEGGTYFEPFLGSGAMFFAIQPDKAVLSDLNAELVNTFDQVRQHHRAIKKRLSAMAATAGQYDVVRKQRLTSELSRAVRFVYLNRNCWGGLYRENQSGVFNVPYGGSERNHTAICSDGLLPAASLLLKRPAVEVLVCDFAVTLKRPAAGDVVYCDPTYREVNRRQFDRYGRTIFQWEDQKRLAELSLEAYGRGAVVIISNTSCDGVRELYPQAGVVKVTRPKGLAPSRKRKDLVEYVFVLDPQQDWASWGKLGSLERPRIVRGRRQQQSPAASLRIAPVRAWP